MEPVTKEFYTRKVYRRGNEIYTVQFVHTKEMNNLGENFKRIQDQKLREEESQKIQDGFNIIEHSIVEKFFYE